MIYIIDGNNVWIRLVISFKQFIQVSKVPIIWAVR